MNRAEHGGIVSSCLGLLLLLGILAGVYVFRHPIMRVAGEAWVVDEPAVPSDAILVLGDDNYAGDRAARAAELYRGGMAPQVVACGRMLRPQSGLADLMAQDLQHDGVPAASIVKFSYGDVPLRGEVESLRALIASKGWKRILVVTSNYDTRRVRLISQHELPTDVTLRVSAAADHDFDPSRWWETRAGQRTFLDELESYAVARVDESRH